MTTTPRSNNPAPRIDYRAALEAAQAEKAALAARLAAIEAEKQAAEKQAAEKQAAEKQAAIEAEKQAAAKAAVIPLDYSTIMDNTSAAYLCLRLPRTVPAVMNPDGTEKTAAITYPAGYKIAIFDPSEAASLGEISRGRGTENLVTKAKIALNKKLITTASGPVPLASLDSKDVILVVRHTSEAISICFQNSLRYMYLKLEEASKIAALVADYTTAFSELEKEVGKGVDSYVYTPKNKTEKSSPSTAPAAPVTPAIPI